MATPNNWDMTTWTQQISNPIFDGGFPSISRNEAATKVFELAFSGDTLLHQSSGTAYNSDGYVQFLANPVAGAGINGTNIEVVDITDDPLFSTRKGLRDTYLNGGTNYSFANQTAFISHNEMQKFYMRLRVKWSSNWQWGGDQLKFCKNKGGDTVPVVSTNCPKFNGAGEAYITKLAPVQPNLNEQNVKASGTPSGDYNIIDDIVNDFGGAGVDQAWSPTLDQWYWLEWEIDAGTAGSANGSYKLWVDGTLYMQLDNVQVAETGDELFRNHELGHVWQAGSPTSDIYMEWHYIEVFDQRPSTLPGVF